MQWLSAVDFLGGVWVQEPITHVILHRCWVTLARIAKAASAGRDHANHIILRQTQPRDKGVALGFAILDDLDIVPRAFASALSAHHSANSEKIIFPVGGWSSVAALSRACFIVCRAFHAASSLAAALDL